MLDYNTQYLDYEYYSRRVYLTLDSIIEIKAWRLDNTMTRSKGTQTQTIED